MNDQLNWMLSSIPLPTLGSIRIRLSIWFFILAGVFAIRLGVTLGLSLVGILMVSVLLHELGHVIAARMTGGTANEIYLSPIGGLASVHMAPGVSAQLLTVCGGPFVNLCVCLATFPGFHSPGSLWQALNPFVTPISEIDPNQWVNNLLLLTFSVNWLLFLINLLPILPLDGGMVVRTLLSRKTHPEMVNRDVAQIGMFASGIIMAAGWLGDWSTVVLLGAILLIVNLMMMFEEDSSDRDEDMFLGYDFSEGYTSFERSSPSTELPSREPPQSLLQRWRDQRRQKRAEDERRKRVEAEQHLDLLLAKVHEHGMDSLTAVEKRRLKAVSDLLRDKGKRPSQ